MRFVLSLPIFLSLLVFNRSQLVKLHLPESSFKILESYIIKFFYRLLPKELMEGWTTASNAQGMLRRWFKPSNPAMTYLLWVPFGLKDIRSNRKYKNHYFHLNKYMLMHMPVWNVSFRPRLLISFPRRQQYSLIFV